MQVVCIHRYDVKWEEPDRVPFFEADQHQLVFVPASLLQEPVAVGRRLGEDETKRTYVMTPADTMSLVY